MTTPPADPAAPALDLGPATAELARLAAGVREDQLAAATPCEGLDVAGLLSHVLGFATAFRDGARKLDGPTTSTPPGPPLPLPEAWRDELPVRLAELAAAWADPVAWTGTTTVGGQTMPAPQLAGFANDEVVVHGWDLAAATGQSYDPPAENLAAAWQLVSQVPADPAARTGLFGPVVPVPDNAPLLDRVLGRAGRDPRWSPRPS